jgi:hypothetical protein
MLATSDETLWLGLNRQILLYYLNARLEVGGTKQAGGIADKTLYVRPRDFQTRRHVLIGDSSYRVNRSMVAAEILEV